MDYLNEFYCELYHFGIPGMKWGRRKAAITPASTLTRRTPDRSEDKKIKHEAKIAKAKKAVKIGAAAVGTTLAVYGTYKMSQYVKTKASNAILKEGQANVMRIMSDQRLKTQFGMNDQKALEMNNYYINKAKNISKSYRSSIKYLKGSR